MKIKHLLIFGAMATLASCSTAYRTGQTPDDVYYSPAPEQNTYVSNVSESDENSYSYRNDEDNEIRRGINNPVYRNSITFSMGMGYGYDPYSLYSYNPFGNPFYNDAYGYNPYGFKGMYSPYSYNPYSYYNPYMYNGFGYYNPYSFYNYSPYSFGYGYGYNPYSSYPIYLTGGKTINTNRGVRKYNLNAYNHLTNSGVRGNLQPSGTTQPSTSMPIRSSSSENAAPERRPRSGVGSVIRRVFTPSERNTYRPPSNSNNRVYRNTDNERSYNNNNNNNSRSESQAPARSFTPSSSSSSSSSSSGSSNSAPVRTFRR